MYRAAAIVAPIVLTSSSTMLHIRAIGAAGRRPRCRAKGVKRHKKKCGFKKGLKPEQQQEQPTHAPRPAQQQSLRHLTWAWVPMSSLLPSILPWLLTVSSFQDVGSNVGYFTLLFSKLVGPQGRVKVGAGGQGGVQAVCA